MTLVAAWWHLEAAARMLGSATHGSWATPPARRQSLASLVTRNFHLRLEAPRIASEQSERCAPGCELGSLGLLNLQPSAFDVPKLQRWYPQHILHLQVSF